MRIYTILISMMILLTGVLTGCNSTNSTEEMDELSLPQPEKKVIVETEVIKQGDLYSEKRLSGQVISIEESDVYANIGGRVTKMVFKEGQVVEKGQVIAQLDSEEQETAINQANDAVDQAQIPIDQAIQQLQNAETGKLQATKRHEQVKLAFARLEEKYSKSQKLQVESIEDTPQKIDLAELKSQWDSAIKNVEKSTRLYEKEIIPRKEVEQAQSQEESARRTYEKGLLTAKEALLTAKESSKEIEGTIENDKISLMISEMELKQSDAAIEQAKITLAQAKHAAQQVSKTAAKAKSKLSESVIRAPFTGVVKKIHIREGGYIAQQAPIVTMFNHQKLKVVASVYPSQKKDFSKGQKLQILDVNGEVNDEGEIVHISPYVDEKGFFQIEASIKGNQTNFIVGEYRELLVETIADKNQLLIPTKAITENDGDAFIYVIKDSKAVYKEVEVLQMQAEWTSVKVNSKPGEEVAVKGMVLLSDGLDVQVLGKNKPVEKELKKEKEPVASPSEKDGKVASPSEKDGESK
ncbi:efflux RND transporter periplasmic adaptor subunit [Sporosarcina limicola]|uniref:RND family efflux transporter MFP subunit n=1 Tax=Sporosarcina limicola TaxID=34101 RepID=A0A927R3W9_9BACL|nr:efflux RND transporter periplasmic adaptor subunit [Sporosarcina limicola]MBE1554223.1 RND family efflux transporter MFP subunit [Sporosarcina limicola]